MEWVRWGLAIAGFALILPGLPTVVSLVAAIAILLGPAFFIATPIAWWLVAARRV